MAELDPILMDCPGGGKPGNVPDGATAQCRYCDDRHPLISGLVRHHRVVDILGMARRGDFDV